MFNTKKILELEYKVKLVKNEYDTLMEKHNTLVDTYNELASAHTELQEQVANLPEYQLGFITHQER